ncbi:MULTISPECIES: phasin family protein [Spirulina sp. CCY15215]|uniref:phasin family protein n=1 Tax=Spirulina sp. CCY15215 TaxID=2767591 RepID=UPI0019506FEB|nr:phasin family protein [Spirulina major]
MDNNSNLIQELLTIGLGTTTFVAEKLGEMGDRLVKEGKIEPDEAKTIVNEVLKKVNTDRGTVEDRMQQQLKTVLQDIGVPRQSEIDELRGRIDRLEHQVRDLENKQWR